MGRHEASSALTKAPSCHTDVTITEDDSISLVLMRRQTMLWSMQDATVDDQDLYFFWGQVTASQTTDLNNQFSSNKLTKATVNEEAM